MQEIDKFFFQAFWMTEQGTFVEKPVGFVEKPCIFNFFILTLH